MALRAEQLIALGAIMIFLGFIIIFFGMMGQKEPKAKIAVGGFIGFIPFGFGNDKKMAWFAAILSVVVFLVWIFFSFKAGK